MKHRLFNRQFLAYLGPAFLVSVGYMDPGNWGTDIEGGAKFGYQLLWVILMSNLMAILLQSLSAKLGIATGRTLPENCQAYFGKKTNYFFWITAELAAMATDLAEVLGGALGFNLLFGIPLFPAALLTGALIGVILWLESYGYRKVELAIIGLVAVINLAYVLEILLSRPAWGKVAAGLFLPQFPPGSALIIVGIVGATVMPHNIYLHSALVQSRLIRLPGEISGKPNKRDLWHFALADLLLALNGAFLVNAAILIMSAATFHQAGIPVTSIEEAHRTLVPLLGPLSAVAFGVALVASGISSSTTATMAGQVVMAGFVNFRLSLWIRRLVTLIPALVVIYLGVEPLKVLVVSQAGLSFQLPFAIIPLILFTRRKDLMGDLANSPLITFLAVLAAVVIVCLNIFLLYDLFIG